MPTETSTQTKVIQNVATLDLRTASAASLAEIKRIVNVATVLYAPEVADQVTRLNMSNVASIVAAPANARVISGQETLRRETFADLEQPLVLVISGQVIINPDMPADVLKAGLGDLIVSGQVLCPEPLVGVVQAKASKLSGQIIAYRAEIKMTMGNLDLTDIYLRSLDDGAELMVFGKVSALQPLSPELLQQKIGAMRVFGAVVCREEYAEALLPCLNDEMGTAHVTIVPAGFEFVSKSLILDEDLLEALPNKKLYCTRLVRIGEGVKPEGLDQALETLIVTDQLICPAALKTVMARKCNLLETDAIFYTGTLWLIEDEAHLTPARMALLTGQATLVVTGELTVAADMSPQLLADRFDKVHNLGAIRCTSEQMAALQLHLGINKGEFEDSTQTEEPDDSRVNVIGNVAYLKL